MAADRTQPAAGNGSSPGDLAKGDAFAGLQIEAEIGRGGMAVIYRARDRALDQVRALKVLAREHSDDPVFQERFRRESRLAASIEHPNVAPIYAAGEQDGRLYIVMRLIDGPSLQELLAEHGRLEPAHAAALTEQIAAALDAAHARGLIHRDVKPANVLLEGPEGEERVFLCDFGITKLASAATELTATGEFLGTVDYVAPEQIGDEPVDPRTDVYSLACVVFHLLAGSPPFGRRIRVATLFAHANAPRPLLSERLPGMPAALDRVLARGMAKRPGERYESAGAFASEVVAAAGGGTGELAWRAAPPPRREHRAEVPRGPLAGERKEVTVLFADLVESLTLAEQTDPEDWQLIMRRFFAILCEAVERFEGSVDRFTGDGIMALFGAPVAHEDHAARACHAAMRMLAEVEALAAELRRERGLEFAMRVGVNSGEVVTGAIRAEGAMEYTAIGQSVGLAERIEELAEPGKAYLSEGTAALVAGYFDLRDLGRREIRGMREQVQVYELVGLGRLRTPLDLSRAQGLSSFVGRGEDLALLEAALTRAEAGSAQVVGLRGEPGIGKSRLCHEFAATCRERGIEVLEAHCRARGDSAPLLPVLGILRAAFAISEEDSGEAAREKIAARVALLDESLAEELPLIFDFLGVEDPDRPAQRMSPEARHRRLLEALNRILRARSERAAAVYVVEDLQWIDPGSESFLENLVRTIPGTRSLLILSFREYQAPWMDSTFYRQLPLAPLVAEAGEALLRELLGTDPSVEEVTARLLDRAGGNPFFIEELVRALAARGTLSGERGAYRLAQPMDVEAIPPTVEAVLGARIDRLPEREKALIETAAVIGREFTEPVLRAVVGLPEPEFRVTLAALVVDEFVYQRAQVPEPSYSFKHQLTRDVAYRSLVADRRKPIHGRVARAIERAYPERLDELAAVVSHHLEQAGEPLAAARWSSRAAVWAGFTAPVEALRSWEKVRDLSDAAGESEEATALGIAARVSILNLGWRLGISDEEARRALGEGRRLAERSGDARSAAMLLAVYAIARANLGQPLQHLEMMREACRFAERSGDRGNQVAGLAGFAWMLFTTGYVEEAFEVTERALQLAAGDPSVGAGVGVGNPYAWCLTQGAQFGVFLGRLTVEEGFARIDEAERVASEGGDLEMVGWASEGRVALARAAGQSAQSPAQAERAVRIAERIGDSFSRGMAHGTLGRAYLDNGDCEKAIPELELALELWRSARTALSDEVRFLAPLAEAQLCAGDAELALRTAREAVSVARERGARYQEIYAQVALARALSSGDGTSLAEAETALRRARSLVEELGVLGIEVFEERARLAEVSSDRATREHELREAHRRLRKIGADARAARVARQIAEPAPAAAASAEETHPDEA